MTRRSRVMARAGSVLPFVIVAVAAAGLLSFTFTGTGLRAVRAARLEWSADRSLLAAEEALLRSLASWRSDSLWLDSLAAERRDVRRTTAGEEVEVVRWRTHPLVVWTMARHRTAPGAPDGVNRRVARAFHLMPPHAPITATLTTSQEVRGGDGTLISGGDVPVPDSPCGLVRDTASVTPLAAAGLRGDPMPWTGRPALVSPPVTVAADVARFWSLASPLTESLTSPVLPTAFPPRRAWHAVTLEGPTIIAGPTRFRGLLLVNGSLELRGAVHVDGVLVVRGPLDARLAQWQLRGAAVVLGDVALGTHSQLFYDRCAVQSALAAVAVPSTAPFFVWTTQSP